jgi:glycine cleavage system transcriptional repressor
MSLSPKDKQTLVLTGSGADKPGLVAGLTGLLSQFEGNIEESTMTRLAGQFATILIVSLPVSANLQAFSAGAKELEARLGFALAIQALAKESKNSSPFVATSPFLFTIGGKDKTGITQRVAQVLADLQANITDLNAHAIEGEDGQVYLMLIEADVPAELRLADLQQALKLVGDELHLDIRIRALDNLSFKA